MRDSADIRKENLNTVRKLFWDGGSYSKLDVSRETGLSQATCNTLLNELETSGEICGEKGEKEGCGRPCVTYSCNKEHEHFMGLIFQLSGGRRMITAYVMDPLGNTLDIVREERARLAYEDVKAFSAHVKSRDPLISQIVIATPSLVENGVIRNCDISELDDVAMVDRLSEDLGVFVSMMDDVRVAAYGYYKLGNNPDDVSVVAYFPSGVVPGMSTVYKGQVIQAQACQAGFMGFLPEDGSREKLAEQFCKEKAFPVILKMTVSIIIAYSPDGMLFSGDLLSPEKTEKLRKECEKYIPSGLMPGFTYTENLDEYFRLGMYQQSLNNKLITGA